MAGDDSKQVAGKINFSHPNKIKPHTNNPEKNARNPYLHFF
jgi:hypothetical protein